MKSFEEARGGRRGAPIFVSFYLTAYGFRLFFSVIYSRGIVITAVAAVVVDFRKIMTMMVPIIVFIISVIVYY